MSEFARVAYIAKTRNLEGSVVASSADGLPFLLCVGMEVHFVPPSLRGPRCARVSYLCKLKEDTYEVSFDGVNSIDEAEKLVDCYCLALKDSLPEVDSLDDPYMLIGFSVKDDQLGDLGVVVEIISSPAQSILVVDGPLGEVMIPVVDELIVDFDISSQLIQVSIPAGLVGMNSNKE